MSRTIPFPSAAKACVSSTPVLPYFHSHEVIRGHKLVEFFGILPAARTTTCPPLRRPAHQSISARGMAVDVIYELPALSSTEARPAHETSEPEHERSSAPAEMIYELPAFSLHTRSSLNCLLCAKGAPLAKADLAACFAQLTRGAKRRLEFHDDVSSSEACDGNKQAKKGMGAKVDRVVRWSVTRASPLGPLRVRRHLLCLAEVLDGQTCGHHKGLAGDRRCRLPTDIETVLATPSTLEVLQQ
ncbi:hypothetical protein AB1Y20_014311 [Prymnesium parvum]|uniref:Uncharacterized protein n=1 Tax=Prymnesium parvum TaxID=97485 RepID=A0AB34IFZ6_PRYPA